MWRTLSNILPPFHSASSALGFVRGMHRIVNLGPIAASEVDVHSPSSRSADALPASSSASASAPVSPAVSSVDALSNEPLATPNDAAMAAQSSDKPRTDEKQSLLPTDGDSSSSSSASRNGPYKSIIVSVCSFILVTEFCERLAYYGLTGSLPIFFRKNLGLSSALATELNTAFTSLSYLTPLLGAYVADKHLGRFSTIVAFCLLYLAGLALCVVASLPSVASMPLFMLGLFGGVAFGAGGIKPNVVVLGADQFNIEIPEQRAEKDSFFNWFYWTINIGATFSYGVLTNIAVNGVPPFISQEYGFFLSFFIPSVVFVAAFIVFYSGKHRYRRVPPKGSALSRFFEVLLEAGRLSLRGKLVLSGGLSFIPGILLTTISYFIDEPTWHMAFALSGAVSVIYGTVVLIFSGSSTQWLRAATRASGGSFPNAQVSDVAQVMRLMPYLSIIIIFWAVYAQQGSNFVLQGCQMDLRIGGKTGNGLISSAMLNVLDSGVILVFIPIFDKLIYPCMSAVGIQPTLLRKIGAGLFFSFLSMMVAGWLEQQRKTTSFVDGVTSNCASEGEILPMSTMSVWWQTPQYLLIGISEILTSISSYDLFYSEVPESMRSVCQALNLLTTTLGYIVAGALNSIFSFWVTTDLNDGKLEYIFYVMALLVLLNLAAFIYVSQSFEYHVPPPADKQIVSGFSPALPRAARSLLNKLKRPARRDSTGTTTATSRS